MMLLPAVNGSHRNLQFRAAAKYIERAGKIAAPVAIAIDAARLGAAIYEDKGFGRNTEITAGSVVGGWAGAFAGSWAGAKGGALLGAAIGSVVPVLGSAAGAAIGGLSGGLVGGIAGAFLGSWAGETGVEKYVIQSPGPERSLIEPLWL